MPNKDYNEDAGKDGGDVRVKGKVDTSGAKFGPLTFPGLGKQNDEEFSGFGKVKNPVKMPGEPKKI